MILAGLALLAATSATGDVAKEAALALANGRTVQAREMIGAAVRSGAAGKTIDRLLADLAFAERRWAEASVRYDQLLTARAIDAALFEKAAMAALHQNHDAKAASYLKQAADLPEISWRLHNVRAVLADRAREWDVADAAYAKGLKLNPESAELRNNLGWSLLMRGRWEQAHQCFVQASALAPANKKILANLELAASALDAGLPERQPGETGAAYAARLNDAGALALHVGRTAKARAAFARALEESDRWFERAANNLQLASTADTLAHR